MKADRHYTGSTMDSLASAALDHLKLDHLANVSTAALENLAQARRQRDQGESRTAECRHIQEALKSTETSDERERLRAIAPGNALTASAIQRINLALQVLSGIERRKSPRFALALPALFETGDRSYRLKALDISAQGLRLSTTPDLDLRPGTHGRVTIGQIGPLPAEVRALGPAHASLIFVTAQDERPRAALAGLLLRLAGDQNFLASQAMQLALTVTERLEKALEDHEIDELVVFDLRYRPIAGTAPPQYTTRSLPFLQQTLPPILEQARQQSRRIAYAVVADRNGYTPVHNPEFSQPPREYDSAFNLIYARDKRIYDDEVTMRAARFSKGAIIQSYQRDMPGHPHAHVLDASAPVFVRGRRWGCARIGFVCEDAGLTTSAAAGAPNPA